MLESRSENIDNIEQRLSKSDYQKAMIEKQPSKNGH